MEFRSSIRAFIGSLIDHSVKPRRKPTCLNAARISVLRRNVDVTTGQIVGEQFSGGVIIKNKCGYFKISTTGSEPGNNGLLPICK